MSGSSLHGLQASYNLCSQKLFESLGFTYHADQNTTPMLQPPSTDKSTEVGRSNLARLLRAWVEISAITVELRKSHRKQSTTLIHRCIDFAIAAVLNDYHTHQIWVKTENAREAYQTALGAHIDQGILRSIVS